jgi:uncharacterized protein YbaR (Trm112 family)
MGLDKLAWALRRYCVPVGSEELVLEVGAGGNPYPRSNVLLDAYEETRERHWAPLVSDRPTVLGFVENLPFRDKVFDFVIAAHVLEHTAEPELFLLELQRVAKAGYIEVPDAFMERINPYKDHRLEITCRNQQLVIRKKAAWLKDKELVELYEDRVKPIITRSCIPNHPFEFHVRYYWAGDISFVVINSDINANWVSEGSTQNQLETIEPHFSLRQLARNLLRRIFSQTVRNSEVKLLDLMRCPKCHSDVLKRDDDDVNCHACNERFPIKNGIFVMNDSEKCSPSAR